MKDRPKIRLFNVINGILFILISIIMLIPIYKVLVDSFDLSSAYGMRLWPKQFGLAGYASVLSNPTLYRPLLISVGTTLVGTFLGLALSTLGAYVLIQWDMPGRTFFANFLLFTMIFNGGMIPTYLVMKNLGLTNNLLGVVLLPAINIYNLVLMRNFFEGIPQSLFEAATLDGCTPMATFIKVVLPLSKAVIAVLILYYAVYHWNDFFNALMFNSNNDNDPLQIVLRSILLLNEAFANGTGAGAGGYGQMFAEQVKYAAIIVSTLPILCVYPFIQKYFEKGVMIGAVKG